MAGLAALSLPLWLSLDGLSLGGHIALGIFLMAAIFWMAEPIPIYATSLLVITLQVLLLSSQGIVVTFSDPPTVAPEAVDSEVWVIPESAYSSATEQVYLLESNGSFRGLSVEVVERGNAGVLVRPFTIPPDTELLADAGHWRRGIEPVSYTVFLGTLSNPIIILFLGGFLLAAAAVRYELERNLTRIFLKPFGNAPSNILLGMMLVTAVLSAFMSNTATTAMMMTVVLPLIRQLPDGDRFRIGLALCIPVAANIGGIITPIGTPPNAIVIAALAEQGYSIPFGIWMLLTTPLVLVLMAIVWFTLMRLFPCKQAQVELELSGNFQRSPKAIALYLIFGTTVILWVTEAWHGLSSSLVALLPIAGLTACQVVEKQEIRSLPWEVLWLVAGGIALGISMRDTGLAMWLISGVPWGALGVLGLLIVFCLVAVTFSNFLSNTVTATLVIPLAIGLSVGGVLPDTQTLFTVALMIAVSCSLGMALPISTPPNAIAYSTGLLRTVDLAKVGIFTAVVGILLAMASALLLWPLILPSITG